MKKIYFTEDIREDIQLGGLTIQEFIRILIILGVAVLFFLSLPLPLGFKFFIFIIPALVASGAIAVGLPDILRKNRRYRKEPKLYEGKKLDLFFPIQSVEAPCIETKNGDWMIFLEASMEGWEHLPPEEQEVLVWSGFQPLIQNLMDEGVGIMIFAEQDKHLPTTEWRRQQEEIEKGKISSGLAEIGRERLWLHQQGSVAGASRKVTYTLRLSLSNPKEEKQAVKEQLMSLASQAIVALSACSIHAIILADISPSLLHQYVPSLWREEKLKDGIVEFSIREPILPESFVKEEPVQEKIVEEKESFFTKIKNWLLAIFQFFIRKQEKETLDDPIMSQEEILQRIFIPADLVDLEMEAGVEVEEENVMFSIHHQEEARAEDFEQAFSIREPIALEKETPLPNGSGLFLFVSRLPTGKSFLALNTAVISSRRTPTVLIDFDLPNRGLHTWANLPEHEQGLLSLFHNEAANGYCPPYAPSLEIYGLDPDVEDVQITPEMTANFWENLDQLLSTKTIVMDVPLRNPLLKKNCEKATQVYAVFDSNYYHFRQWKKDWKELNQYCEPVVVWNQKEEGIDIPFTDELGCAPKLLIPRFEGALQSLYKGRPFVLQPNSERQYFDLFELEGGLFV
ncbi:hypothetical protein [Aneurinibacillus terranovensis]|uniref:hypothetical protein n=1 Tax=Aneurinibacillus terranovensis TaxID=278991 RepID=UPI000421D834|nr:hypothetical protein [Aneurinibacillus terranovensis]